jgi:predicted  nucleic acid-binding Zn-ribbon protein
LELNDQLLQLVRLQDLILDTRAAHSTVTGAPAHIEEIEERFRERNAEYVAVKQRFEALEEDQRTRSGELELLEEQLKKYKADLMQVQNQREYAAMLREIDSIKSSIAEHEEAILRDMEEIETTKTDLASHETHIKAERESVAKERAEVESACAAASKTIEELTVERRAIESGLPRPLVASILRLEEGRQGQVLSRAEDGVCQSCFVRVRPQVFQEIKLALKIHCCSNCQRLLVHEPSLKAAAEKAEAGSQDSAPAAEGVEAVNGGAV